jgi:hypothetical protein
MLIAFDANTNTPVKAGRTDDGEIAVQVLSGAGVWVGKTEVGLSTERGGIGIYDGFLVLATDGVVVIPWSGDVYLWWPERTSDVFVQFDLKGCVE